MMNSVAQIQNRNDGVNSRTRASLYDQEGRRKYVNAGERRRFLDATPALPRERALFALTLAWTGARVSEVLALTPDSFQLEAGTVAIVTLKRRRPVTREVPLPPRLMAELDRHFDLRASQTDPAVANRRLWSWCRATAWRMVKAVMADIDVTGRRACPRGLRHGFGVGALQADVPLNLVQRWLGHARMETTAIYANAVGPEERIFAARFWQR